jgi:hypothetical protein
MLFTGVTKRGRLSWLTNNALVCERGVGGGGGYGVSANEYGCSHGAQVNFGDLTPYLAYGCLLCRSAATLIQIFGSYKNTENVFDHGTFLKGL